jgi:hypothetical protein
MQGNYDEMATLLKNITSKIDRSHTIKLVDNEIREDSILKIYVGNKESPYLVVQDN